MRRNGLAIAIGLVVLLGTGLCGAAEPADGKTVAGEKIDPSGIR